jgi:uncharacterized protein YacL
MPVFEISGCPIVKTNLTLIRMTWIARIVARLTTKYFLSVRAHVGGWILSYPLSILKVIFLESNPLRFIQTLISFIRAYVCICPTKIKLFVFVFRKQTTMAPFWKGDAMRYCATGNVDRTFCPKLLPTKQTFDLFFLISVT